MCCLKYFPIRSLDGSLLPIYMDRQNSAKSSGLKLDTRRLWSTVKPHNNKLSKSLGQQAGQLTAALMEALNMHINRKLD